MCLINLLEIWWYIVIAGVYDCLIYYLEIPWYIVIGGVYECLVNYLRLGGILSLVVCISV